MYLMDGVGSRVFSTKKGQSQKISRFSCDRQIEPLESRILLSTVSGSPTQLSPAMIEQAYDLKNIVFKTGGQTVNATGAGETIAIVDAFGDPSITSDLQTFDANFGLSDNNASGQFVLTVATPQGPVSTDPGWAGEEALDVEWAHAIAPQANILLVEASSSSTVALTDAVVWAKAQTGVVAVSMSWGSIPDFSDETSDDPDFTTPAGQAGVTFIAASGDNGQPNYPSTSANVLAVGGTTLTVDASGNLLSESAWSGSGGGHSADEGTDKPDVAYDGNPSTGFLVFDSVPNKGISGWEIVGGTSAGSPQWAGIIALVDQGRSLLSLGSLDGPTQTIPEINGLPSSDFNDVTGGGLTGLGSPIGVNVISALVGGGITSVSSDPAPTATQLAFSHQPGAVVAGNKISPNVTVSVEDSSGNVVSSDNSSVTISIASGPGSLGGIFTVTAVNGIARFTNLSLKTTGNYTLEATDGTLNTAISSSFTVTPAAATHLVFVQPPSDATAGSAFAPSLAVELEDQFDNLVNTNTSNVTLTVASGPGTTSGTTTVAAVNGIATFSGVTIKTSGAYTLNATDGSLAHIVSSSFNVNAAAPSKVVITQQPSDVTAGSTFSPAVAVAVEDAFGNVVIGDSSSITLATHSGPGPLGGTAIVQAVGGVATFSNVSLTMAGNYTLQASDGGLASATSSGFNVAVAAASQLAFGQQPSNVTAGSTMGPAVTVAVEDPFGNVVTTGSPSVTLSVNTGPGLLGGIITAQAVNGAATFGNLSLNIAGSYTLQAAGTGLSSATSSSFNVNAAAASQIAFMQQPSTATAAETIGPAVMVQVEDAFGNAVTSDSSSVTLSVASGPSFTLNGTLTEQAVNGVAAFGDLSLNTEGTYTLAATDGALAAADSANFVIGVIAAAKGSPATHLVFVHQVGTLTAGAPTPSTFVVDVEDQLGELVTDNTSRVRLSVLSGPRGSAVRGTVSVAAVGGVATFNNVFLNVSGNYMFQAKDGKLAAGTSQAVVVNPAAAFRLLYVQQPSNATAGNAMNPPVVMELQDRFKNIATNDDSTVTLSVLSGPTGARVGGNASVAAVNGVATFGNLQLDTAGHYRLTATEGALSLASKNITILPAITADVSFMQQPLDVVAGHPFTSRIQVLVTDAFENAVTNGTIVTLSIQSGPVGSGISGKPTATVHKGIATFPNVTFQTAGEYMLTATAGAIFAESDRFAVTALVATPLTSL
jgi:hypothetical protein